MRVSATVQLSKKSPYYLYDNHSVLNIQLFNQTKMYTHDCIFFSTIPAIKKKKLKGTSVWLALWLAIQKEVISKQKQPSCKNECGPQKARMTKDVKSKVVAVMVG